MQHAVELSLNYTYVTVNLVFKGACRSGLSRFTLLTAVKNRLCSKPNETKQSNF